jgi:hypothetical protein
MAYDIAEILKMYKGLAGQVKVDLGKEFSEGRIKATEYADVYNRLIERVLTLSFESPSKEAGQLQSEAQTLLIEAQTADQEYVTQNIRPEEKKLASDKVLQTQAQTTLLKAQAADQTYVTNFIRPEELAIAKENLEIKGKELLIAGQKYQLLLEETDIKKEELKIAEQKLLLAKADIPYKEAQTAFTNRQIEGFEDQKKQKMLDIQLNAWSMMFSSGLMTSNPPAMISSCQADNLYINMTEGMGLPGFTPGCSGGVKATTSNGKKSPCPEMIAKAEAKAKALAQAKKDKLDKKADDEVSGD